MWNYSKAIIFVLIAVSSFLCRADAQLKLAVYEGLEFVYPKLANNIRVAFQQHNIPIILSGPLPPQRSLALAISGRYVGDILRQPGAVKDYDELMQIPVPLTQFKYWVWVLSEKECSSSQQALEQKKPIGLLGLHYFDQAYEFSDVGHEEVKSVEVLANMLKLKRADYTVGTQLAAKQLTSVTGLEFTRCFDRPMISTYGYMHIHQKHQSWFQKIKQALMPLSIL